MHGNCYQWGILMHFALPGLNTIRYSYNLHSLSLINLVPLQGSHGWPVSCDGLCICCLVFLCCRFASSVTHLVCIAGILLTATSFARDVWRRGPAKPILRCRPSQVMDVLILFEWLLRRETNRNDINIKKQEIRRNRQKCGSIVGDDMVPFLPNQVEDLERTRRATGAEVQTTTQGITPILGTGFVQNDSGY